MLKRIFLLSGIAIIGVVIHHAFNFGFISLFTWTNRYLPVTVPNYDQLGSANYWFLSIILRLSLFGVSAFLFVSGFFIAYAARGKEQAVSWPVISARIKNLAIPYLIWSLIIFTYTAALGKVFPWQEYLRKLVQGDAFTAYYYIPLIIQLYLLSPLMIHLARRHWKALLVVAALLQFGIRIGRYVPIFGITYPGMDLLYQVTPAYFFPTRVFYFALGIVVGLHMTAFKNWLATVRWPVLIGTVFFAALSVVEYELLNRIARPGEWLGPFQTISDNFYAIGLIFSVLAFDKVQIPWTKEITYIGSKSYGIYLTHLIFIQFGARAIYHLAPQMLGNQFLMQPILIALGLGLPLLLMAAVAYSPARAFYRYQFG